MWGHTAILPSSKFCHRQNIFLLSHTEEDTSMEREVRREGKNNASTQAICWNTCSYRVSYCIDHMKTWPNTYLYSIQSGAFVIPCGIVRSIYTPSRLEVVLLCIHAPRVWFWATFLPLLPPLSDRNFYTCTCALLCMHRNYFRPIS